MTQHAKARTLFDIKALFTVLGLSLLSIWPVFLHQGVPYQLTDSFVYVDQGERIISTVKNIATGFFDRAFSPGGTTDQTTGAAPSQSSLQAASADADGVRSLPYAAFVGLLAPVGLVALVWIQTCLVMLFVYALFLQVLPKAKVLPLVATALVMLTLTSLPFVSALVLPDAFGAIIVLYGILLVYGFETFDLKSQVLLTIVMLFAIFTHYGNIPLAFVVILAALFLRFKGTRWFRRTLVLAGGAIAISLAGNLAVGHFVFDEISLTPRRLPILLARSMEDGPALWHLEEHCDERGYAVCTWFGDDIPNNVGDALWNERGMEHAPSDLYKDIRDQELSILWAAFREYPVEQVQSLTGNMVLQLTRVGIRYANPQTTVIDHRGRRRGVTAPYNPLASHKNDIGRVQAIGVFIAFVALCVFAFGPRSSAVERRAIFILLLALLTNAAIFGGLSAHVDRYQSRIAWLVPLLALALLLKRLDKMNAP